jgi:hypothetical protein
MNFKNLIAKPLKILVDKLISPFLAPIISFMASTGFGTDNCLKWGCLPISIHYYQPIPDISDLERRNIWNIKKDLSWINSSSDVQLDLLLKLGQRFGLECEWPLYKTENPLQFYTENSGFSFGCAASLYSIIRNYKPKYIIEIGSGNSSLVIHEALLANNDGKKYVNSNYSIIDPNPGIIVKNHLNQYINLFEERVELVNLDIFKKLGKNDILFIDSSHTVRIGGDVNRLILDIIPNLSPGVIIHFHDIPFPYEYPKIYSTNPAFRMFWTESYLLQAFLLFNKEFEILLAMNYVMQDHLDVFKRSFRNYDETNMLGPSSSFWIRRVE